MRTKGTGGETNEEYGRTQINNQNAYVEQEKRNGPDEEFALCAASRFAGWVSNNKRY